MQLWSEGDYYVTSTGAWLVPQDLKNYFRGAKIGIVQSALAPGVATEVSVSGLPRLSCLAVGHLVEEMTKYFPEDPTEEELLAAFLDPRLKRHLLVFARINYARTLLESRLELALLDAFEDDEEAPATADAGAGDPAVSLLPTAHSRLLPTTRCVASVVVQSPLRLARPQPHFSMWCARPRTRRRASSSWPRWKRGFPVRTSTPR